MARPKATTETKEKKVTKDPIYLKVRVVFIDPILGSSPGDPEIYRKFIGTKSPDAKTIEDEVNDLGVEEVVEKQKTIFPKLEDGRPFLYDYQIRGFFKNSAKAMYQVGGDLKLTAYKTKIDNLIFVEQRRVPIILPEGTTLGECQRPLRASTAQGERIALANSDEAPAGSMIEFTIKILDSSLLDHVKAWLDYGKMNGMNQWHNSGKGRFIWKEVDKFIPESQVKEKSFEDILNS